MIKPDKTFIDRCIKDDKGNITITQSPNLPIIVWIIATVISKFTEGTIQTFFGLIAFGAIFTWAWLELFQGVNYLRKALGLAVLIATIYSRL